MNERISSLEMRVEADRQDYEKIESMQKTLVSMSNQHSEFSIEEFAEMNYIKNRLKVEEQTVASLRMTGGTSTVPAITNSETQDAETDEIKAELDEMKVRHRLAEQWLRQVEDDEWRTQEAEEQYQSESKLCQRMLLMSENMQAPISPAFVAWEKWHVVWLRFPCPILSVV